MKKLICLGLVTTLVIFGINNIIAQPRSAKDFRKDKSFEKLNLTDVQKEKFKEIKFNFQEGKIDLEATIKKNKLEVKKLSSTENFDKNTLMNLIDKGSDLRAQQNKLRVKMWLDIRDILDDNQKKIWANSFNHFRNGEKGKRFLMNDCDRNIKKKA